ncbi:MAG: lysostaphin resistance A-like protein [Haloarculaceae archaeon]
MAVENSEPRGRRVVVALVASVVLAVVGLAVGAGLVQAAGALLVASGVGLTASTGVLLSAVLLQGVAFGGVALVYLRVRGLDLGYLGIAVPDLRQAIWAASGYVLALVGALSIGAVAVLAGLQPAQNRIAEMGQGHPEIFLLLVPVSFLLIGPGEELLFRGLIQGRLREVLGPAPAIALASVVFAAAHLTSLSGALSGRAITIGLLLVPALVLGVAYERTGNLVVPALIHGAYNATLFALAYVSLTYQAGGALLT